MLGFIYGVIHVTKEKVLDVAESQWQFEQTTEPSRRKRFIIGLGCIVASYSLLIAILGCLEPMLQSYVTYDQSKEPYTVISKCNGWIKQAPGIICIDGKYYHVKNLDNAF